ncbi:sensor histidine kinase [Candidatus Magnetominusculus dajiuhuensis]|uniref:sensor histidine kinase n=1 Tax=Candidatus Magnetominusculus dajiuhuensis TaxID=3137712 RepID=UPI003B42B9AC
MKNTIKQFFNLRIVIAFVAVCLITVVVAYVTTKKNETRLLRKEMQERLAILNRFQSFKLESYAIPAKTLSENPIIVEFCNHIYNVDAMNEYLSEFSVSAEASLVFILNSDGITIASSNYKSPKSLMGVDYSFREYYKKAIKGQPNTFVAQGTRTKLLGYYNAYPIRHGADVIGVAVVKYDLLSLLPPDIGVNEIVFISDTNNVIFDATDNRYMLHTMGKLPEKTMKQLKDSKQYLSEPLPPLPVIKTIVEDNATIITLHWNGSNKHDDVQYLMEDVLSTRGDWHIYMLVTLSKINPTIIFNISAAVSLVSVIFLIVMLLSLMALDIKRRKEYEQSITAANNALERMVNERTLQLQEKIGQLLSMEQTLHEKERKYRQLVELSMEGIWAVDNDGITTFVNHAIADMLGYTMDEMLGVNFLEFMDDEGKIKAIETVKSQAVTGHSDRLETTFLHKSGKIVYAVVAATALIDDNRNPTGSFAVISDITKRRETETQLKQSMSDLERAYNDLKRSQQHLIQSEKMASLGGMVAGVAHEINTPVGIAYTLSSNIVKKSETIVAAFNDKSLNKSQLEDYITEVEQNGQLIFRNLQRTADLIKSFKMVAADQVTQERRTFRIKEYLEEILLTLHPKLKHCQLNIEITCSEDLTVDSYPGAFAQIITNLLLNSLIHAYAPCDKGDISIKVVAKETEITVEYKDDGKGISQENLNRIFDPFFTTRRGTGGTGLGLHIVFNIVTQTLGGRIDCKSTEGEGATFIIEFPTIREKQHD